MNLFKKFFFLSNTATPSRSKKKKQESFSGIGTVKIFEYTDTESGRVYGRNLLDDHNLIVEKGRGHMIDLLTLKRQLKLKYIRWGKGGAPAYPNGDPLNPYEVEDSDTNVTTSLLDKEIEEFNRLSTTELECVATVISDEIDDDVNEAVLLFEDQDTSEREIFARITFPTIRLRAEKGSGIEVRWIIDFNKSEEILENE